MTPIASPPRTVDSGHRALPGRARVRERAQDPARGEPRDPASGIHHDTRAAEERRRPPRRRPGDRRVRPPPPRPRRGAALDRKGIPRGPPGAGVSRSFTAANGPVPRLVGAVTRVTVHIVLEQEGAAGGPDFWASVPNPTTVAAIEAAWRGDVVALGSPAEAIAGLDLDDRGSGEQGGRVRRSVKPATQLRRDLRRVKGGAHGRGSDALKLVRIGSHAERGP